jgi:hydroxypyruvate isomerase
MDYRGHELSANVSLLFTELPYSERFAAAADAGFALVESWWPFPTASPTPAELDGFVAALAGSGATLNALNFYGGDLPNGERGIASHPDREDDLAANLRAIVEIAARTGVRQFNLLYGQLDDRWSPAEQASTAEASIRAAATAVAGFGGQILLEPLSQGLNGRYPLLTADDVLGIVDGPLKDLDNVSLLFDTFHLANNGVDLLATATALAPRLAHVQLADTPGRGEPGSGTIPFDPILDALRSSGYQGVVACEYNPRTTTTAGLDWIKGLKSS